MAISPITTGASTLGNRDGKGAGTCDVNQRLIGIQKPQANH